MLARHGKLTEKDLDEQTVLLLEDGHPAERSGLAWRTSSACVREFRLLAETMKEIALRKVRSTLIRG